MTKRTTRIEVSYKERSQGPMSTTHHWHAQAWVGDERVESSWCYSEGIAWEEALSALAAVGVEVEIEPELEQEARG